MACFIEVAPYLDLVNLYLVNLDLVDLDLGKTAAENRRTPCVFVSRDTQVLEIESQRTDATPPLTSSDTPRTASASLRIGIAC
jgi:hypothetical protein